MENISDKINDIPKDSLGFLNHVFNFNKDNKCEILNVIQYSLLSIVPSIIILKIIKNVIPEEDNNKNNVEIVIEIVGQLVLMILGMWFSHKAIIYMPTYSECKYSNINFINMMLPFIILMFTMQTKLGSKINILYQRLIDAWDGNPNNINNNNNNNINNNNIRITQPLPNNNKQRVDYNDRNQLLPNNIDLTNVPTIQQTNHTQQQQQQQQTNYQQEQASQPQRDFNDMYNAQYANNDPIAANSTDSYSSW
jgi:hypothetical protein